MKKEMQMSAECDECFLSENVERLEDEVHSLEKEKSDLFDSIKEILDVNINPSFRTFSAEEKIQRMNQIARSALRRKW